MRSGVEVLPTEMLSIEWAAKFVHSEIPKRRTAAKLAQ
jgi:hypothetical protein